MSLFDRPGHGPQAWDERYAGVGRLEPVHPNETVAEICAGLPPGWALDVACGEGRHAIWLAQRGWQVTAVDFSSVGVGRGREAAHGMGLHVDWVVADVTRWQPAEGTGFDLVLMAYLHLPDDVMGRLRGWLAPGGRLVVVGHAVRNLTDGVGGPRDVRLLHDEASLRRAARGLRVERLGEVVRPTDEGDAIDIALLAQRPC